ncbi:hypothetical protein KJ365_01370 [Glaciecola sp. XM2]|jgi:hypothetical protein|uniref:hypothetical protein n=1 Tax=Glaciecola sp. XM2 TaxID=1914931 RepID=UPI001BDEF312|nr:hypothetical protein [Glaciecola sp. XM2]MBT1449516.1 hypothetical protein [Glaciecola sp. XM2]
MKVFLAVLSAIVFLFGCSQKAEEEVSAGRYGMMSTDTPQHTAVMFIRAIYNEETLDKAVELSDERFGRLLLNQHTNRNVQRHVLNLRLDDISVDPVSGGTLLYSEKQVDADIEVKIVGTFDYEQIVDLKTISMIRESGQWKVIDVKNTIP